MVSHKLNNIAASTGYSNLWIYSAGGTKAAVKVANYFDNAIPYGMKNHDVLLCTCSDASFFCKVAVSGTTVTLSEMDTFA